MANIAVIPARGGSKRIKDKNIAPFCGKPMIQYALEAARDSGLFDVVHVSTDSEKIRAVVEGLGFPVDFLRAPALADDHAPIMPVLRWVLERYGEAGRRFEDLILILPCAPLIEAADLRAGHQVHLEHGRSKAVLAVAEFPVPIEWAFDREPSGGLRPCRPGMFAVRSQDLAKKYYDTGTFIVFNAAHILDAVPPTDDNYVSYVLPKSKAVDIDTVEDWEFAQALYRGRRQSEKI